MAFLWYGQILVIAAAALFSPRVAAEISATAATFLFPAIPASSTFFDYNLPSSKKKSLELLHIVR